MSLLRIEKPKARRPIVLIGAGGIVHDAHLPAYRKAGLEVTSIFDLSIDRARSTAAQFGIPHVSTTLEEAIATAAPNAVFDLAIPASAHLSVLAKIPGGRAVLLQKPMGENLAEAQKIRDLCHEKELTAAVNFQMRYVPSIRAARVMIAEGRIGMLHDLEVRLTALTPWHLWTFLEPAPRVEILYHSIHYVDLIRSFLGDPERVYAKTVKHPKMPKLASTRTTLIMDYGDVIRANITANHGHEFGLRHQESYVKWEGTEGAIKAKLGLSMNYPEGVPDEFEYCVLEPGKAPAWTTVAIEGTWFPDAFIGPMTDLMCFLDGVTATLPTSVEDAYKTMAVVEAAYESSASGGTRVAYD